MTEEDIENMTDEERFEFAKAYIEAITDSGIKAIQEANTEQEVKELEKLFCGKNGIFTLWKKELGQLIKEDRENAARTNHQ